MNHHFHHHHHHAMQHAQNQAMNQALRAQQEAAQPGHAVQSEAPVASPSMSVESAAANLGRLLQSFLMKLIQGN